MNRPTNMMLRVLAGTGLLVASVASAQTGAPATATVTASAPIYIAAAVSPTPLRVAAAGTVLKVLEQQDEWLQVEFNDPALGPRVGWIQGSLVKLSAQAPQPQDLSLTNARAVPAAEPANKQVPSASSVSQMLAQVKRGIPRGANIYIEEIENDLDGYIRAEMLKKKVPLTVVLRRDQAHVVLTGSSANTKKSWTEGWLTADKDHSTASVMVIDRFSGHMVWAGEAGDRSLWLGSLSRGGPRKVAQRVVDGINKAIVASTGALPPPPPLSDTELDLGRPKPVGAGPENVPAAPEVPVTPKAMTNADVITLVSAGVTEDVVLIKIKSVTTRFRLETEDIVELKRAGVSDRVIAAMIEASRKQP
jgi:hypothetical protein